MRILCLESGWATDPDVDQTVGNLLKDLWANDEIDSTLQYCASKGQMKRIIAQVNPKAFDVAYFATHGRPGKLDLTRDTIDVETLSDYMDGNFHGKIIYFGACAVLNMDDAHLRSLVKKIGARYICGYTRFVDWTQSRAMDMLVLQDMACYERPSWLWKDLMKRYGDLMKETGFYMYW